MRLRLLLPTLLALPVIAMGADSVKKPELPPWKVPSTKVLMKKIGPSPAADSKEAQEDLAEVIRMQKLASPAQIAVAKWDYNLSVFTFSEIFGKRFTAERYPQTARLFLLLNNLVQSENTPLKNFYKRPHPYQVDPKGVKQIVVAIPGYSYPSYHSARCVVFAHVLTMLNPANRELYWQVARQVEWDRVLGGEHFPSDIRAGKKLGELVYAALLKDKKFLAAVKEVKTAEWSPGPGRAKVVKISIPKT